MKPALPRNILSLSDRALLRRLPRAIDFAAFEAELRERITPGGDLSGYAGEVTHHFRPGFYVREYRARAGSIHLSRTHKMRHPFRITQGRVAVWTKGAGVEMLRAVHTGITEPGTQRILLVVEDLIWTTFHANPDNLSDPDEIMRRVTEPLASEVAA